MSKRRNNRSPLVAVLCVVMVLLVGLTGYMVKLSLDLAQKGPEQPDKPSINLPWSGSDPAPQPEPTQPQPETVAKVATIAAQGDMLMHGGLFNDNSVNKLDNSTWEFSSIFRYLAPYTKGYDYALANLETTFGGDEFPYQGWPLFNVPDALATAMTAAGYDMLLTSNNHCYDTVMTGLKRSLEVARAAGLETLGTRLNDQEPRYLVREINGIPIGLVSYTYTTSMNKDKPQLNGNSPVSEPALVNYFAYDNLNAFYQEMEQLLADMKAAGAKATVLFIHWGQEYQLVQDDYQNKIAQTMCNLGVDVIVGGHPHVVQPMTLLTAADDPSRKTVCIFSLGNAVSNQRIEEMNLKTGHTEDGVVFSMTFEEYTDGEVYLAEIAVLPTWVNLHRKNGGNEYNILPLEDGKRESWQSSFSLTDEELRDCEQSWKRTMDLLSPGLEQVQQWLAQQKQERDDAYLRQAQLGAE